MPEVPYEDVGAARDGVPARTSFDDVGARNKLKRFFHLQGTLDYDAIARLLARWQPYAGVVYFHLLLDSLTEAGLLE